MSADGENERVVAHREALYTQRLTQTASAWARQSVLCAAALVRTEAEAVSGGEEAKENLKVTRAVTRHVLGENVESAYAVRVAADTATTAADASAASMSKYAEWDIVVHTARVVAESTETAGTAAAAAMAIQYAFTNGSDGAELERLAIIGNSAAVRSVRAIADSVESTGDAVTATEWAHVRAWAEKFDWVAHDKEQYKDLGEGVADCNEEEAAQTEDETPAITPTQAGTGSSLSGTPAEQKHVSAECGAGDSACHDEGEAEDEEGRQGARLGMNALSQARDDSANNTSTFHQAEESVVGEGGAEGGEGERQGEGGTVNLATSTSTASTMQGPSTASSVQVQSRRRGRQLVQSEDDADSTNDAGEAETETMDRAPAGSETSMLFEQRARPGVTNRRNPFF
ncbi:hypothetical protein B484DRAFT_471023 [Ochromonadaceae sp. CCMP2298]|nr:hypothetical protein B484DRAFT_471023 [Ochromonadaceae sp. CCMP2298]